METKTFILTEDMLLGQGRHKKVYVHPDNCNLCIKTLIVATDTELERELSYRRALQRRKKNLPMMVGYYGTVPTNQGVGYVFERILDNNGQNSRELTDFMLKPTLAPKLLGCTIEELLLSFRKQLFTQKIVVSNIDPWNFMIQIKGRGNYTIRVIDNIGTPVHLPLAYYFDYIAGLRIKRYWKRFLANSKNRYPDLMTTDFLAMLSR